MIDEKYIAFSDDLYDIKIIKVDDIECFNFDYGYTEEADDEDGKPCISWDNYPVIMYKGDKLVVEDIIGFYPTMKSAIIEVTKYLHSRLSDDYSVPELDWLVAQPDDNKGD